MSLSKEFLPLPNKPFWFGSLPVRVLLVPETVAVLPVELATFKIFWRDGWVLIGLWINWTFGLNGGSRGALETWYLSSTFTYSTFLLLGVNRALERRLLGFVAALAVLSRGVSIRSSRYKFSSNYGFSYIVSKIREAFWLFFVELLML